MSDKQDLTKTGTGFTKDIAAPATLGDVMLALNDNDTGLDRVRNVLALRMNQYNDIALSPANVKGLARAFKDISAGAATNLVLVCKKDNCLYKNRCTLYEDDICPEGKECFHENYMLMFYMDEYLKSLEVDVENMPEMVLINMLVEYEVLEYRCNAILSNSHTNMTWTRVVGLDKQGEIVEAEEVSYALTIKESVQKRKLQILQEFTATRKEKWRKQAALKETREGPSKIMSSLKASIKEKMKNSIDKDEVRDNLLNPLQDEDYKEEIGE
jgi:hypothetical protein